MTEKTTDKQQRHGFKKGQSGNPQGRPAGSRNKSTMAAESLLAGQAEQITQAAIDAALSGDPVALKLCLERIAPVRKNRIEVDLPTIKDGTELPQVSTVILEAVANGQLSVPEGQELLTLAQRVEGVINAPQLVWR